jgi:hypothetical protein
MGLLDEAIRDHLELKRRNGADPSEIARAEHDALEPVFPPEETPPGMAQPEPSLDGDAPTVDGAGAPGQAEELAQEVPQAETAPAPDFSTIGQETAELDVQALLDADPGVALPDAPEAPAEEESFEWESPVTDAPPVAEGMSVAAEDIAGLAPEVTEIPGQERMSFE